MQPNTDRTPTTKRDSYQAIKEACEDEPLTIERISERTGMATDVVESDVRNFKQKGEIYEPQTGEYRTT